MAELSEGEVRALAAALGLSMTPEDLTEVTHRLNAFVDALAPLAELPADVPEPLPLTLDPGEAP